MDWKRIAKINVNTSENQPQRRSGTQKFSKFTPSICSDLDKSERSIVFDSIINKIKQNSQMNSKNASFYSRNDNQFNTDQQDQNTKQLNSIFKESIYKESIFKQSKKKNKDEQLIEVIKDLRIVNANLKKMVKQLTSFIKSVGKDWKRNIQTGLSNFLSIREASKSLQVSQRINEGINQNMEHVTNQINQFSGIFKLFDRLSLQNKCDDNTIRSPSEGLSNMVCLDNLKVSIQKQYEFNEERQVKGYKRKYINEQFATFSETINKLKQLINS